MSISANKRPGPNGIPGVLYKRFASYFVEPFLEAFEELQRNEVELFSSLGERIWKVIPKTPGADTQAQLRDLEMPNEHRKVLARLYAIVLDEQASKTMTNIQQAFLKSRNITNANVALGEGYYAAVDKQELRYWLLMDCTHGYNYLSWQWRERALRKAGLPDAIRRAVLRLVQHCNSVVLLFRTHTCAPLQLFSGLAQGCPLSCILYVLAVDPFLEYIASIPDIGIVIGFCDDWSAECRTASSLKAVQAAGEEFELCSGQSLNRIKTKILPTRRLTQLEVSDALQRWPGCPIVARAKVLGLWHGYDYKANEIGQEVEAKYYKRISLLRPLPSSFAAKIVMLNVFMRSLWSYLGRHLMIPLTLRKRIEDCDSRFLSGVQYFPLGVVSHLTRFYGLRVRLQDFELANVAGLIATAWQVERSDAEAARLLRDHAQDTGQRHHMRPSAAFATAFGFYLNTVGETVAKTVAVFQERNAGRFPDSIFKLVYQNLVRADFQHWTLFWERRIAQCGFNAADIRQRMSCLRAGVSQAARWTCLRMHLNALPTARRLRFVTGVEGSQACLLCRQGEDSQQHLFGGCPAVQELKRRLSDDERNFLTLTYQQHCLSAACSTCSSEMILRLNDQVVHLRRLSRGHAFHSMGDLVRHGEVLFNSPGLRGCASDAARSRRQRRANPSLRNGYALYRAENLTSRTGALVTKNGWGVLAYGILGDQRQGIRALRCCGCPGAHVGNNECAYHAVLVALEHAAEQGCANVCIQTGSTIVAKHVNSNWACRASHLKPLLSRAWSLSRSIEARGGRVIVEHVAKCFNKTAATLAARAAASHTTLPWGPAGEMDLQ